MNILCIGDVVGSEGCSFLRRHLSSLKKDKNIDLVIVNGENSADGNGITPQSAEFLFSSGADVITTGNHCFRRKEIYDVLDENPFILRPLNFGTEPPGRGMCIVDKGRIQIGVINLMGTTYMENIENPFLCMERLLKTEELPKITVVDFHAEATGEKGAMAFYLNGRVSAVFGTHTHVPTADIKILDGGTGFISDVGMTGPINSVLGVEPADIIKKLKTNMPVRFNFAKGECKMDCAVFTVDEKSGRTTAFEAFTLK